MVTGFFCSQNSEIPIVAVHGVPGGIFSTDQHFQRLKSAGFTHSFAHYPDLNDAKSALKEAEKNNIKLIISTPGIFSDTEATVKILMHYPALFAYYVKDEPSPSDFAETKYFSDKIRKVDSSALVYINLLPNYAPKELLGGNSYKRYAESFLENLQVPFLSFDNYPVQTNGIRKDWHSNLDDIRETAKKFNLPFWAFANSTIHFNYPEPTVSALKLQHFSNLLYGAQGLQYFTYWTNENDDFWIKGNYGYAIVDGKGNPTPTFDKVKQVNKQINNLAWVFKNSTVNRIFQVDYKSYKHKNIDIPTNYFFSVSFNRSNALVSHLSNANYNFIAIQNISISKKMNFSYTLKKEIFKINNLDGKKYIVLPGKHQLNIDAGDVLIFCYPK